jgi:hypothetical protein
MTPLDGPTAFTVLALCSLALVLLFFGNTPLVLLLVALVVCGTLVDLAG